MPAIIKPLGGKHAISNVLFVFEFAAPLPPPAFEELRDGTELHELLKADLPRVVEQQQMMMMNFPPQMAGEHHVFAPPFGAPFGAPFAPSGMISGIAFDRIKPNGEPALSVNIQSNALMIICGEYVRWANLWAEVKNYLEILSEFLGDAQFSGLSLQYTDAFKVSFQRGDKLPLTDLFSETSRFVPSNISQIHDAFHSHHGFFSEPKFDLGGKLLTNVNVNVNELASVFDVQITTVHKYQLSAMFSPVESSGALNPKMEAVFQYLHDENKVVVGDLLTNQVKESISFNSTRPE